MMDLELLRAAEEIINSANEGRQRTKDVRSIFKNYFSVIYVLDMFFYYTIFFTLLIYFHMLIFHMYGMGIYSAAFNTSA